MIEIPNIVSREDDIVLFAKKIDDFDVFYQLPPNIGKKQNPPLGRQVTSSLKIEHVGGCFAPKGYKIDNGFTDILSSNRGILCLVRVEFCPASTIP